MRNQQTPWYDDITAMSIGIILALFFAPIIWSLMGVVP